MKVIIITGPTGGHFFPGLAIGERLIKNFDVEFFVPERKFIIKNLEIRNFKYKIIPYVKLTKKNFIFFIFKFFYLIELSIFIFLKKKPDIVIGTGSYVCVPFVLGAKILNKKIVIHEQNYIPGKATKILAPFVNSIFLTFPNCDKLPKKKCIITGFPLIFDFYKSYSEQEIRDSLGVNKLKTILVIGGSQGSKFLNNLILKNLEYFKNKNFQIIHIAGNGKEDVEKKFIEVKIHGKVYDFFYEMNKLYSIADYVICRAGSGTLVEIVEKEIPAFLIPYPYAGGHQKKNAEYLEKIGCAFLVEEKQINDENFPYIFEGFLKKSSSIKENLKKIKLSEKGKIEEFILQLIKKEKNGIH
ncbi:MAG: UDP-N-acetylglucosamine--N-acetylmuramyl-(pentapeptide) pyrophosphoryl-undecaprenol N-acetylglucosamine transferase [Candidatus Omnitrophica bacterium]|nr:UDP-N-acetylglucosamine--N-acetylmuramyl-(pentapeptide) pyrophosphoryl-undecaprenol N-acetylglucosamine transferase [Candidatus Omnitrophota bacterium]